MLCSCNSDLIDYFTLQSLNPGKCDSRAYLPSHVQKVDERRVFKNHEVKVPYNSCLESNYHRATFEFKWVHENATIQLQGSQSFVRQFHFENISKNIYVHCF